MLKDININKIGFIGLGVMGMSMFKNLAKYKKLSRATLAASICSFVLNT